MPHAGFGACLRPHVFVLNNNKKTQINAGAKKDGMEAFAHCEESAGVLGAHVIKSEPVLSTVSLRQVMVESKPDCRVLSQP